jgi:predicted nucleotidyltransferase
MSRLSLIADEVHVNERTLRRAINEGSLRAIRASPRTLRLPLAEQHYIRRSWPLISALRRSLRTEHNVRFALLFGSAARGTDTALSDIDVLVVMRDASLDRVIDLEAKLTAAAGRHADIVRLEDAARQPSFLADVAAAGRVLVDRDGIWTGPRKREHRLRDDARLRDAQVASTVLAGLDEFFTPSGNGRPNAR